MKKHARKLVSTLLAVTLISGTAVMTPVADIVGTSITASAAYEGYTAWTGTGTDANGNSATVTCYWKVDDNGKLTIAGTVPNTGGNNDSSKIPWYTYRNNITEVYVEEGAKTSVDASRLFADLENTTSIDVSNLDTSDATNMFRMFANCKSLTSLDVSSWNTSKVTNMSYMFSWCRSLTSLDLNGWDTSSVTGMHGMFYYCQNLIRLDVSGWNTTNITDMGEMFYQCESLTSFDVSGWDTSKVTTMYMMFTYCKNFTSLDFSGWNTSSVKSMSYMFYGCQNLATVYVGSDWNTNNVTSSSYMFNDCTSIVGGKGTTYNRNKIDKTYAHIDGGTNNPGYFTANTVTVTWLNEDGTELGTTSVENGTSPVYSGETPTKADYAEYRYIFSGWTDGTNEYAVGDTLPAVTGDVVYTATFITASRFEETIDAKSPTCVEDGNIAYFVGHDGKYYTLADGEYTEVSAQDVVIPATGIHTAGEPVKENEVAPTYESEGSYEEVVYCSVCGEEISRQTVVVPMRKLIDVAELYMNNGEMYFATLDIPEGDTYKIRSKNAEVASVNSRGRIVARGEGTAEIEITTSSGMSAVCTVEVTDIKYITLDKSELVMNVKDSYTFTATYPDTETCSWKSSDPNVVTVDLNGKIVARGEGTATIYARTQSSIATCEITVNKVPEEIILDKTELSLNSSTKEMYTLKVALSPEDAQTTLTFKSSNPSVASVNSKGRIVARGEGTATIKVISTNGKVATCTVQVS